MDEDVGYIANGFVAHNSSICRFMDGKVFSVGASLDRYTQVAAGENPEDVKELQPWAAVAKDEEGKSYLYVKQAGERVKLATIEQSGVGNVGDRGSYNAHKTDAQLQAMGVCTPPSHAHCRATLVPSDASPPVTVQVPRASPPFASPFTPSAPAPAEPPVVLNFGPVC